MAKQAIRPVITVVSRIAGFFMILDMDIGFKKLFHNWAADVSFIAAANIAFSGFI